MYIFKLGYNTYNTLKGSSGSICTEKSHKNIIKPNFKH